MKTRLFPVGFLLIASITTAACSNPYDSSNAGASAQEPNRQIVAVCPTFLPFAQKLDANKYDVLPTTSTAQSMQLLADGKVDAVLAGRALKPQEPIFPNILLGNGYSFLASQEIYILESDLQKYNFVTNLDTALLQETFGIRNIQHVENIYNALEDHIAITDFESTDYKRASPVHFMHEDGSRVLLSRIPVLYCAKECTPELQSFLRAILPLSPISYESS